VLPTLPSQNSAVLATPLSQNSAVLATPLSCLTSKLSYRWVKTLRCLRHRWVETLRCLRHCRVKILRCLRHGWVVFFLQRIKLIFFKHMWLYLLSKVTRCCFNDPAPWLFHCLPSVFHSHHHSLYFFYWQFLISEICDHITSTYVPKNSLLLWLKIVTYVKRSFVSESKKKKKTIFYIYWYRLFLNVQIFIIYSVLK